MSNLNIKEMRSISEEIESMRAYADYDQEEELYFKALYDASKGAESSGELISSIIIDLTEEPTEALIDTYKPEQP